jgi:SAM-dependent methyltransferase
VLSRLSRRVGWPAARLRIVEAIEIAKHYGTVVFDPRTSIAALRALPRFLRQRKDYQSLPGAPPLRLYDDNPQLFDQTAGSPFDPHYLHQDAWAAREIHGRAPARHVDVGSRVTFVAGIAAFVPTTFVDLRPLGADVPNLESVAGDVLQLPFGDQSVESLSCLHVAEHIGLGRYGDPLNPHGTHEAARELARVLAPDGSLYFGLPIGRPRTNFNAHRVHDPLDVISMFPELELADFAAVDDDGRYNEPAEPADFRDASWGCGLYRFTRRSR